MEKFPWWTDAQIQLANDARIFVDEVLLPLCERDAMLRKFPWAGIKEIAKKGWFGALIPKHYGGKLETWGVTGAAIITEEVSRAGLVVSPLGTTMFGAAIQLVHSGNMSQQQKWLPAISRGELIGCITMTEPYAGSDIAGIETTALGDGDHYVVNGKKRFQTIAAAADLYMCYFATSTAPEDRKTYRHLSAFVVEKGTPGFHVERINDTLGFDGIYNCYLTFDNCSVPTVNRLGNEGDGWKIMMGGLNIERILNAAPTLGPMRESLRYANQHLERRLQFGKPLSSHTSNQFKLSDMIWKLYISRLLVYYSAHCAEHRLGCTYRGRHI